MQTKETIDTLVGEVLDGTEIKLAVDSYRLEESFEGGEASIACEVHDIRTGEKKLIEGSGVGLVDAFFNGLTKLYSGEFPSLTTIRFAFFSIKADLETGRVRARSDSTCLRFHSRMAARQVAAPR